MDAPALAHESEDAIWRLRDVTLAGRTSPRLDRISLDIPRGITAVLGESGAGKTSLVNVLVAFERADDGAITFRPRPSASRKSPDALSRGLNIFWSPPDDGLWPHRTVREHLLNGVDSLLDAFALRHLEDAYPATLSAGERSRLSVARAISSNADVLVLDEPFANVDRTLQSQLWSALIDLARKNSQSMVIATHHPDLAVGFADHVICLASGRVLATGSPRELYHRPPNREVAERFGPCNWLTSDELVAWELDASSPCIRPEQLAIERAGSSAFVVDSVTFLGDHEQVRVRSPAGLLKTFLHRPATPRLRAGDGVVLRWIALLLLVCMPGCDRGVEQPLLLRSEEVWTLPTEGTKFPAPRAVTPGPKGEAFVLDNVGRVLVLDDHGDCVLKWWMPEYSVGKPERVLVCRDGTLAIADTHYHRVVLFDQEGHLQSTFGSHGEGAGQFIYPVAIAQDDRDNLYVCEYGGHDRVQVFRPDGTYLREFGGFGTAPGQFQRPSGILWRDGKLFIVDAFNNRVQVFHDDGRLMELPKDAFAAELHYPYDIASGPGGSLYVVEYGAGRVTKFAADGKLLGRFGRTGDGSGQLSRPWGLGVDERGRVLIADTDNRRIVRWTFAD